MKNIIANRIAAPILVAAMFFMGVAKAECPAGCGQEYVQGCTQGCSQGCTQEYAQGCSRPEGRILQCSSADGQVLARVWLDRVYSSNNQIPAFVYKTNRRLPSYWMGCTAPTSGATLLSCAHDSNRTLIINRDYTGRYIGSHETHELSCTLQ